MDGCTCRWMYGRMCVCVCMDGMLMDIWNYVCMDGCMCVCVCVCMDGMWMDV